MLTDLWKLAKLAVTTTTSEALKPLSILAYSNANAYEWTVVGAGPAGIATVDKLLQAGIPGEKICWIDPEFCVGDFGSRWRYVSSNTSVKLFRKFYAACENFHNPDRPLFAIESFPETETCLLDAAAEPLRWITENLVKKVNCLQGVVTDLSMVNQAWSIKLANDKSYISKNVVLAIGAEPQSLYYPRVKEIPLVIALNPAQLEQNIATTDRVAVFGSSHSAIILLKELVALGVREIINFYQFPLKYAVNLDDWILFDNTGLKGNTAAWARENLHGLLPANVTRVLSTPDNIAMHLTECNKVIYATGFKSRQIRIEELSSPIEYNARTGIIALGLFGVGIAFPETKEDRVGNLESRVGIWKFMDYLQRVVPVWLQYGLNNMEVQITASSLSEVNASEIIES